MWSCDAVRAQDESGHQMNDPHGCGGVGAERRVCGELQMQGQYRQSIRSEEFVGTYSKNQCDYRGIECLLSLQSFNV